METQFRHFSSEISRENYINKYIFVLFLCASALLSGCTKIDDTIEVVPAESGAAMSEVSDEELYLDTEKIIKPVELSDDVKIIADLLAGDYNLYAYNISNADINKINVKCNEYNNGVLENEVIVGVYDISDTCGAIALETDIDGGYTYCISFGYLTEKNGTVKRIYDDFEPDIESENGFFSESYKQENEIDISKGDVIPIYAKLYFTEEFDEQIKIDEICKNYDEVLKNVEQCFVMFLEFV